MKKCKGKIDEEAVEFLLQYTLNISSRDIYYYKNSQVKWISVPDFLKNVKKEENKCVFDFISKHYPQYLV